MNVKGIAKVRNESHIIEHTLDTWGDICTGGVHVYIDCSTDGTAEKCRRHPAVVEVIESDHFDKDRERAEWYNRNLVFQSAKRYLQPEKDWIVYFDGDEPVYDFDTRLFESNAEIIRCLSYDVYITPDDAHLNGEWMQRDMVGPEYEVCLYAYRMRPWLGFHVPDQRNMTLKKHQLNMNCPITGYIKHWGKGISVRHWENKCNYYADVFGPKYAEKWAARRGKAIHTESDFGNALISFEAVRRGEVEGFWRRTLTDPEHATA